MQLGRSERFLNRLLPAVRERFGDRPAFSQDNFVAWNQQVNPALFASMPMRVSYPAHVILRYEIERALIDGEIEVDDIPSLWDEKMQHWLGLVRPPATIGMVACRIFTGPTADSAISLPIPRARCMPRS